MGCWLLPTLTHVNAFTNIFARFLCVWTIFLYLFTRIFFPLALFLLSEFYKVSTGCESKYKHATDAAKLKLIIRAQFGWCLAYGCEMWIGGMTTWIRYCKFQTLYPQYALANIHIRNAVSFRIPLYIYVSLSYASASIFLFAISSQIKIGANKTEIYVKRRTEEMCSVTLSLEIEIKYGNAHWKYAHLNFEYGIYLLFINKFHLNWKCRTIQYAIQWEHYSNDIFHHFAFKNRMYCVRLKLILIAKLWIFPAVTIVMRSSHLRWVTYALTVSRSISFICYNPIYVDISSDNSIITNRMKPKTDSPKWTYRSALNHFREICLI